MEYNSACDTIEYDTNGFMGVKWAVKTWHYILFLFSFFSFWQFSSCNCQQNWIVTLHPHCVVVLVRFRKRTVRCEPCFIYYFIHLWLRVVVARSQFKLNPTKTNNNCLEKLPKKKKRSLVSLQPPMGHALCLFFYTHTHTCRQAHTHTHTISILHNLSSRVCPWTLIIDAHNIFFCIPIDPPI